jgi:hypothetical protein
VYQISGGEILDEKVIAFGSTTLSILLLVFSQMESAQDYKIRAQAFQKCALEVDALHQRVRIFKTLKEATQEEKITFCEDLSVEYHKILNSYSNHHSIDYDYFKSKNRKYYAVPWLEVAWIRLLYYIRTKALYHMLIGVPILVYAYLLLQ